MSGLELDPERMREMGHMVVDRLVDLIGRLDRGPVFTPATPEEMSLALPASLPSRPVEFERLWAEVEETVAPHAARWGHPRTLAYVPGRPTWPGALADFAVAALNLDASSWRESPAPVHLELTVIDWFRRWLGFPDTAGGLLVGGGSAANLTALAAAREALVGSGHPDAVVYCSAEAHSSVTRACRVLGFDPGAVHTVAVDRTGGMRIDALEAAIGNDLAAGRRPLAVVASAGATGTGAVDPLGDVADLAHHHRLWMHVDAAYGGFAILTDRGRVLFEGIDRADSVTLDPHKWLYQPIEVGAVVVRHPHLLERAFSMRPAYLQDTTDRPGEMSMTDRGLQQTRAVRALKVWMSLMCFGTDAFRQAIDRCLDLALHAQSRIEVSTRFELMSPAQLSVVCFRRTGEVAVGEAEVEALNAGLVEGLLRAGVGFVSSTRIHGRYALRLCILNHTTTRDDVDAVIDWLETAPG
jgi:glutamate/tyrosine decarboxylase-like PLP-dependent enzyme